MTNDRGEMANGEGETAKDEEETANEEEMKHSSLVTINIVRSQGSKNSPSQSREQTVEPKVERRLVAGKLSSVHVIQIEKEMGDMTPSNAKHCHTSSFVALVKLLSTSSSAKHNGHCPEELVQDPQSLGKWVTTCTKTIREAGCPKSKPKIFQSTWYISIMQKGEYVGWGETTIKERSTGYSNVYAENNVEEGCTGCGNDSGEYEYE
ncbi:hypothetical protein EV401DRAFT_1895708 [Pisolithus croceorrhizus]|nr:hypothetical protein EV401DRAFT_1895708 [Pisolithus croceorrhizus]